MRDAQTVLGIIRDRGQRGLPLTDVYRQLYNPELYLLAYSKLARNAGSMTPGIVAETVDGMSVRKVEAIIAALRYERYRWSPVKRVYIDKPCSSQQRPLGMPTWSDKLLQEVIRLILEAYYEPRFSNHSHGFRPQRGCHTALSRIYHGWKGTTWFIEGDISRCFDSLDHAVLMAVLQENMHDNRFLQLIRTLLDAGYVDNWTYSRTLSGTPQGGIVSPILANIYLDRLDTFVERELLPEYTRGAVRRRCPEYLALCHRVTRLRQHGATTEAAKLAQQLRHLPAMDPNDPQYRRLRYVRYADDFLLGFAGPRSEAECIRDRIGAFLRDELRLELSPTKTVITHGATQAARFLGYDITVLSSAAKHSKAGQRLTGQIGLRVPAEVIKAKCQPYMRHGKPAHCAWHIHDSVFSIIAHYDSVYRGIAEYYRLAYNMHSLNKLRWVMQVSLTETLACKLRISTAEVYRRYRATIATPHGPRRVLEVHVPRDGKRPLVARWGGVSLRWRRKAVLYDAPQPVRNTARTELLERLLADRCELCGSTDNVQVHHVRHLRDLARPGRITKTPWERRMIARRRRTLVVCHPCHWDIHRGTARPPRPA